jgi:hypothetical protein
MRPAVPRRGQFAISLRRAGSKDLDAFIAARSTACRSASTCMAARSRAVVGGADLGEWFVRNDLALDRLQKSRGRYGGVQHDANTPTEESGKPAKSSLGSLRLHPCKRQAVRCSDDPIAHPQTSALVAHLPISTDGSESITLCGRLPVGDRAVGFAEIPAYAGFSPFGLPSLTRCRRRSPSAPRAREQPYRE